ncbi:MAG: hypothetical protein V3W44_11015 [Dehalococcoidales bacterium]
MQLIPAVIKSNGRDHAVKLTVGKMVYRFDDLNMVTAKALFTALSVALNLEYGEEGVLELLQPVRFP